MAVFTAIWRWMYSWWLAKDVYQRSGFSAYNQFDSSWLAGLFKTLLGFNHKVFPVSLAQWRDQEWRHQATQLGAAEGGITLQASGWLHVSTTTSERGSKDTNPVKKSVKTLKRKQMFPSALRKHHAMETCGVDVQLHVFCDSSGI
jgi:hypothetical protein